MTGTNIRAARKAKGLTMKELGTLIGTSESAVSLYETGKREPNYETLLMIAEALDTTVGYLLGTETEKAHGTEAEGELLEYLEELRTRPEFKMLFHTFKDATKGEIEAIVTAWEARNNVKGE
jgi:transcriptional regulator with XRE-family HTH domain